MGDITVWAGWAILLGSIPVAIGLVALVVLLQIVVRLEERGLALSYGEQYTRYAATTQRFFSLRRRDTE